MRGMILAAGRGERMRPLTDEKPKALLDVHGKPLIQYHVEKMVNVGVDYIVINQGHLGEKIEYALGDGRQFGIKIEYSPEGETPLETGGGIFRALHLLEDSSFIAINADIWTDFDFSWLPDSPQGDAHLVLVDNPQHNNEGDFFLKDGRVMNQGTPRLTFSGIGVYTANLFHECVDGTFPLAPLLRGAAEIGNVTGQYYGGTWIDVGTPERLQQLNETH